MGRSENCKQKAAAGVSSKVSKSVVVWSSESPIFARGHQPYEVAVFGVRRVCQRKRYPNTGRDQSVQWNRVAEKMKNPIRNVTSSAVKRHIFACIGEM